MTKKIKSLKKASMGPQLYRCGNSVVRLRFRSCALLLQWGRNFIVAEINQDHLVYEIRATSFNGAATLSLRKCMGGLRHEIRTAASMGPQLYRCGNIRKSAATTLNGLQASMGPQLYRCGNATTTTRATRPHICFNGAATLSLRKSVVTEPIQALVNQLQWGRNFIVAEICR